MVDSGMSILATDFGSVHTRVLLIDVVDGEYRVVARRTTLSTKGYPENDVGVGLLRVLDELSRTLNRRFLNEAQMVITPENADRQGVDAFVTTTSAGRPIRAVMVGLMPDLSFASALRAVSSTYVEPVASIHLKDGLDEEGRLNAILLNRPDLIFIAGGTQGGAQSPLRDLLDVIRLALHALPKPQRPLVLYAGNAAMVPDVTALFADLTACLIADNIRPGLLDEHPESALVQLGTAYDRHREKQREGFGRVSEMSSTGLLPTAQSYVLLADYFGQTRGGNVLAVDIGSTSTILAALMDGKLTTRIDTQLGLGQSADTLLQTTGEDAVARWLPFYPEPGEIVAYALNKTLRPATIPMNLRDLYLEHALLRAGLYHLMRDAHHPTDIMDGAEAVFPAISTILAGGAALTRTGHPAYNMMLIADALQPTGVTEIIVDPDGLIPPLAAITRLRPEAAAQLIEGPDVEHLGTLITVTGEPEGEQIVAELQIQTDDGTRIEFNSTGRRRTIKPLEGGRLFVLPISQSDRVSIRLRCRRGFSVNGKRRFRVELSGGMAGIMIDTRGRPLGLAATPQERAAQMPRWVHEVTGDALLPIPNAWLVPPSSVPFSVPDPDEAGGGSGGLFRRRKRATAADTPDDGALFGDLDEGDTPRKEAPAADEREADEREADELDSLRNLL